MNYSTKVTMCCLSWSSDSMFCKCCCSHCLTTVDTWAFPSYVNYETEMLREARRVTLTLKNKQVFVWIQPFSAFHQSGRTYLLSNNTRKFTTWDEQFWDKQHLKIPPVWTTNTWNWYDQTWLLLTFVFHLGNNITESTDVTTNQNKLKIKGNMWSSVVIEREKGRRNPIFSKSSLDFLMNYLHSCFFFLRELSSLLQ